MRKDRARIQIGQISGFGLLELSRQRLRPSVVENSSELCSHCGGSGRIQSIEVSAVQILRSIEEEGADDNNIGVNVYAHSSVILHILNKKRDQLSEIQSRYNILIEFINDNSIIPPLKKLETVKKINTQNKIQTEKKENQEGSAINDQENNNRRKRGKKIGRKNKKVIPNEDLSNEEETKNNNQINKSETKATDKTDQNEINKNIKKRKNTPENNKKSNESKSKKNKSVKITSENDNKIDDEKNNINETATTETKNPRIVQTSSPIEVTEIDNDTKPQKPKRKGWWSK
jgi:ribonuclease E